MIIDNVIVCNFKNGLLIYATSCMNFRIIILNGKKIRPKGKYITNCIYVKF